MLELLEEAGVSPPARDGLADDLLARWPYRSPNQLVADVPAALPLRRARPRLSFGRVVSEAEQATLASLARHRAHLAGAAADERPV